MISNFLKSIWSVATEHWGLKLVSLLIAIGIWFYAVGEEMIEVSRSVSLRIETDRKELSIANHSGNIISVRLRAPRSLLSVLSAGDVTAYHQITGISQAGEYSFRMVNQDINLPSDEIQVLSIFPETITVSIDETIVKKLAVEPSLAGEPAFGYKVLKDKIEIDPNAVLVEGPKVRLSVLEAVKTEPIELVGRTRSFRKLVRIVNQPNIRPTSETIIDVFIPIREEYGDKSFANIPVKPLGLPSGDSYIQLETETVTLELKGPASELERLTKEGLFAYVEVSGLEKGFHEIPVKFILPDTVSLKEELPPVKLSVKKIH